MIRWIWNFVIGHFEQCNAWRQRSRWSDQCQRRIGHPGPHVTFTGKEWE